MKYLSWNKIMEKRMTKCDLFKGLNKTFDYALPRKWLEEMTKKGKQYGITYDMISCSTVWVYPESIPYTVCIEVNNFLKKNKEK